MSAVLTSPVVSTQWLADHLGADKLVVLDATVLPYAQPSGKPGYLSGHESYLVNGHVPGAVFADVIEHLSEPGAPAPFTHQDPEAFAAAVGALGIDNETTVVVYDAVLGQWAARVWWLFRANGYDDVAVLDGGLTLWRAEERELEVGHVEPTPATFTARARPELWAQRSEVESLVDSGATLVCGVPPKQFTGEEGSGHIPGSVNVPPGRLLDRERNTVLRPEQLREALAPVLDQQRVVAYCNGGIAAAADALALTLVGHRDVAIYDGSLTEWTADPSARLVTTA